MARIRIPATAVTRRRLLVCGSVLLHLVPILLLVFGHLLISAKPPKIIGDPLVQVDIGNLEMPAEDYGVSAAPTPDIDAPDIPKDETPPPEAPEPDPKTDIPPDEPEDSTPPPPPPSAENVKEAAEKEAQAELQKLRDADIKRRAKEAQAARDAADKAKKDAADKAKKDAADKAKKDAAEKAKKDAAAKKKKQESIDKLRREAAENQKRQDQAKAAAAARAKAEAEGKAKAAKMARMGKIKNDYLISVGGRIRILWNQQYTPSPEVDRDDSPSITFSVRRDGTVYGKRISHRAKSDSMNRAAQLLLDQLTKLPPLPAEYDDDITDIECELKIN